MTIILPSCIGPHHTGDTPPPTEMFKPVQLGPHCNGTPTLPGPGPAPLHRNPWPQPHSQTCSNSFILKHVQSADGRLASCGNAPCQLMTSGNRIENVKPFYGIMWIALKIYNILLSQTFEMKIFPRIRFLPKNYPQMNISKQFTHLAF